MLMQFFRLKDAHGHFLSVVTSGEHRGSICSSNSEGVCKLYAFVLTQYPGLLFLCAEDKSILLHLSNRPFRAFCYPVGIEGGDSPHTIALYDLLDHSWLCFPPLSDSFQGGGQMQLSSLVREKLSWESICIVDFNFEELPYHIKEISKYYKELFSKAPDLDAIKKVLFSSCSNEIKQHLINTFYPLLGVKELNDIAYEFRQSSEFKLQFLDVFADDFWCQHSLIPLFSWERERFNRSIILCNQKYDVLQSHFMQYEFSSFSHAINCVYRRSIEPTRRACIVTTVRNEGSSILEWIAWHKKLGFEHFFIFSNDNDDGSDALLHALAEANIITWIKNDMGRDVRPQAKVCNYAFSTLPEILDFEWCLLLDVDEFLSINRDSFCNISDLLKWIEKNEVDSVGFNWKYTCSSDNQNYTDFITTRIKYFIDDNVIGLANNLIKSMSKPRYMISSGAHNAVWCNKYPVAYRLIQGDIHRYAHNSVAHYSDDPMWADYTHRGIANIIHYHYKSAKEFLLRMYRGDVLLEFKKKAITLDMFEERVVDMFIQQHMKYGDQILDNFLLPKFELQSIIDQMLSSPKVYQAYQQVLVDTDQRINDMIDFLFENQDKLGANARALLRLIKS